MTVALIQESCRDRCMNEPSENLDLGDKVFTEVVMARYASITIAIIQVCTVALVLFITFAGNIGLPIEESMGARFLLTIGLAGLFFAILLGITYMLQSTYMILRVYVVPYARIYPLKAKQWAYRGLRWEAPTWVIICNVLFILMITSFLIGMAGLSGFAYKYILNSG